jgi:hypothetical protein
LVGIPTYVNEQGHFDFVLDTSAGNTVITPKLANSIGVQTMSVSGIARGLGGDIKLKMASLESIS